MRSLFFIAGFMIAVSLKSQDTVRYIGKTLSNVDYHHGQLSPAMGVHNIQTMRANRSDKNETSSWTYNHAPMLAYWNNETAGCIALTKMKEGNVCEMKRLYVKPFFRKNKIGRILVDALLQSAKEKGYRSIRLDTLEKLQPAIRLYNELGFKNISPYYFNPLKGVVYMEKEL